MAGLKKLDMKQERTREWLESQTLDDELESIAESSVVDSCDDSQYNDSDTEREEETVSTVALGTQLSNNKVSIIRDTLRDLMNSINSIQTVGNVNISNSTNVHIGNVTNINGNIQIIADSERSRRISSRSSSSSKNHCKPAKSKASDTNNKGVKKEEEECEERVGEDAFLSRQKFKIPNELCSITPRDSWLAQMPMEEYEYLEEPVKYVVILHTATGSSEKRAINIRYIRDIQCFHIESRGWNDIAYNFVIGCDGNIYEGRGWSVVGAHTLGYNKKSIGISFIGCFMKELPPQVSLNMCKNLMARGVELGHIAPDYRLVCHCQCNSTESPGRRLYEEIKTWDHFYNLQEEDELH